MSVEKVVGQNHLAWQRIIWSQVARTPTCMKLEWQHRRPVVCNNKNIKMIINRNFYRVMSDKSVFLTHMHAHIHIHARAHTHTRTNTHRTCTPVRTSLVYLCDFVCENVSSLQVTIQMNNMNHYKLFLSDRGTGVYVKPRRGSYENKCFSLHQYMFTS